MPARPDRLLLAACQTWLRHSDQCVRYYVRCSGPAQRATMAYWSPCRQGIGHALFTPQERVAFVELAVEVYEGMIVGLQAAITTLWSTQPRPRSHQCSVPAPMKPSTRHRLQPRLNKHWNSPKKTNWSKSHHQHSSQEAAHRKRAQAQQEK